MTFYSDMTEAKSDHSSEGVYYNEVKQDNASFTNRPKVPGRGIKTEEPSDFVLSANGDYEKYVTQLEPV